MNVKASYHECLGKTLVSKRNSMVEEVPILIMDVPYVRLKDQYAPTRFAYAMNLHQHSKHLHLALQVFQEVAHEGDIN